MFFRDVITLVATTDSVNSTGDYISSETTTDVFADKVSVRQSEFYQGMAQGIRPELAFRIRSVDYNEERLVTYNSKRYEVIRTYDIDGELMDIIVGNIVGTEVR